MLPTATQTSLTISVAGLADGAPRIPDARVQLAGRTYTTRSSGLVILEAIQPGEYKLQVTHPQYAPAFPRIHVVEGHNTQLIELLPLAVTEVSEVEQGAVVESQETRIEVPARAFAGEPAGTVQMEHTMLDAGSPEIAAMPGEFSGESAAGKQVMIESLGAISLTFRDESGRELQVADGKTIDVRMPCSEPIPADEKTIPLWSFDENSATWVEEGTARVVREDGACFFEMELPHLSWWNVDRPIEQRTSIRIADVVLPGGRRVAEPLITAAGMDYNGNSAALGRMGKFGPAKGRGFCVDVKPNSRVKLTVESSGARLANDVPWYSHEMIIKSGAGGNSCREDAGGGLALGTLKLKPAADISVARRMFATYGKYERLNLRDGTILRGAVIEQAGDTLIVDTGNGLRRLQTPEVEYITYPRRPPDPP